MRTHKFRIGFRRRLFASLLLIVLVATGGTPIAESAEGRRGRTDFPDVNVGRDQLYKRVGGRDLRLDIHSPRSITHPLPIVLWIHGNRWS